MATRPAPPSVALVVCGLLLGTALVMAYKSLALAADGSYYLVRILGSDGIFGPDGRFLANAVRQAPVLMATHAGVTDMHALSILLGLGQLVLPALIWSTAILLSRSRALAFFAVSMTAGICLGTTYFFNVGESVLAVSLTALVGVLLWRPSAWTWSDTALAAGASAVLLASYETAVATGTVLAIWAAWRARDSMHTLDRRGAKVVASLSALSALVSLVAAVSGKGPSNARSSLYFVLSADPWPLYVAVVGVAAIVICFLVRTPVWSWLLLVVGIGLITLAVMGLDPSSVAAFQARGGAALTGLSLVLFLLGMWAKDRGAHVDRPGAGTGPGHGWLVALPVVFVGATVLVNLRAVDRWHESLEAFRAEVDGRNGVVQVENILPLGRRQVVWDWTSSSLSLVVRSGRSGAILVDHDPSFIPFPPESARHQLADKYTWHR